MSLTEIALWSDTQDALALPVGIGAPRELEEFKRMQRASIKACAFLPLIEVCVCVTRTADEPASRP